MCRNVYCISSERFAPDPLTPFSKPLLCCAAVALCPVHRGPVGHGADDPALQRRQVHHAGQRGAWGGEYHAHSHTYGCGRRSPSATVRYIHDIRPSESARQAGNSGARRPCLLPRGAAVPCATPCEMCSFCCCVFSHVYNVVMR